jgi:hypothetical protein
MRELTPDVLKEAVELINQLRGGELSEEELSAAVVALRKLLPDPNFMGYTVDHLPELSAAEVVSKAFLYRPISL